MVTLNNSLGGAVVGRYKGKLTATWKRDGRLMELQDPFAFIDNDEEIWDVPAGAQIDGASIPQFLWSITGSPYTGKYRDASVVHDWFCSVRTRTSDATHAMFYEAMLVSGVSTTRARVMYAAVRYAGPKWTQMDIHNTNIASKNRWGPGQNYWGPGGMPPFDTREYAEYEKILTENAAERQDLAEVRVRADANAAEFNRIVEQVLSRDLEIDAIDDVVSSLPSSGTRVLDNGLHRFTEGTRLPLK